MTTCLARCRRLLGLLAGALLVVLSTASASAPANAHGLLAASDPADGASVERAPTEVLLTFTETPDPALATVQVIDSSGSRVDAGKAELLPGQPARLRVPVGNLAQGTYTVTWRMTSSEDGHTTAGSIAFGVGVAAGAAGTEGVPAAVRSPTPTAAAVTGRWLFYVGVVLMLGAAVVGVVVVRDPGVISRRGLAAAWMAAAGGVLLTIVDQRSAARTSLSNLLSSSTGHKLTTQAIAVAVAAVAVVWVWLRPSRSSLTLVGIGASGAMLARALAGHANASSVRWFTVGMQWLHLVSVGAWVGGLVWLLVAVRRGDPGQGRGLARRFSSVAGGTLAVVAVSGTVRALDEVGAWGRLVDTSFGVTLLVKVALVAALVVLGARNRFRHVRAAVSSRLGGLRRAVRAEVAIAAGVLGLTALLAGLPPSASVAAASRAGPRPDSPPLIITGNDHATGGNRICGQGSQDPAYNVTVASDPDPPRAEGTTFLLTVRRDGKPVTGAKVCMDVDMPDMQHPGVSIVTTEASPGRYGASVRFSMVGAWTGSITVAEPEKAAVSAPMRLEVK